MNKRNYQQPAMQVRTINIRPQLLSGSPVRTVTGNVFTGSPQAGHGEARGRSLDSWEDEE